MRNKIILFDINETVIDLNALRQGFQAVFGDEGLVVTWFSMLLHSSTVCLITDVRADFASLASIALDTLAARHGLSLSRQSRDDLLKTLSSLPPHSDIKPALTELRHAGFRTVAFSNSSARLLSAQIGNAGLNQCFDELMSVEDSGLFKPDPDAYRYAAKRLMTPVESLRLVAAHDWDTHGAISAGLDAAYLNRSGGTYNPLYKKPEIFADSMHEIVKDIIELDREMVAGMNTRQKRKV